MLTMVIKYNGIIISSIQSEEYNRIQLENKEIRRDYISLKNILCKILYICVLKPSVYLIFQRTLQPKRESLSTPKIYFMSMPWDGINVEKDL